MGDGEVFILPPRAWPAWIHMSHKNAVLRESDDTGTLVFGAGCPCTGLEVWYQYLSGDQLEVLVPYLMLVVYRNFDVQMRKGSRPPGTYLLSPPCTLAPHSTIHPLFLTSSALPKIKRKTDWFNSVSGLLSSPNTWICARGTHGYVAISHY